MKHQGNVWNLFKVSNKGIRETSPVSLLLTPNLFYTFVWCFHPLLWIIKYPLGKVCLLCKGIHCTFNSFFFRKWIIIKLSHVFSNRNFHNWDTRQFILSRWKLFPLLHASTHFSPIFYIYTPWKRQKTKGFLMFSGGVEMKLWAKMG